MVGWFHCCGPEARQKHHGGERVGGRYCSPPGGQEAAKGTGRGWKHGMSSQSMFPSDLLLPIRIYLLISTTFH
jgi:hypothetical protein